MSRAAAILALLTAAASCGQDERVDSQQTPPDVYDPAPFEGPINVPPAGTRPSRQMNGVECPFSGPAQFVDGAVANDFVRVDSLGLHVRGVGTFAIGLPADADVTPRQVLTDFVEALWGPDGGAVGVHRCESGAYLRAAPGTRVGFGDGTDDPGDPGDAALWAAERDGDRNVYRLLVLSAPRLIAPGPSVRLDGARAEHERFAAFVGVVSEDPGKVADRVREILLSAP